MAPEASSQSGGTSTITFDFSQAATAASALVSILPQQILTLHHGHSKSSSSSSTAIKYTGTGKGILEEEDAGNTVSKEDDEGSLLFLEKIGAGLRNLGNTCFLNAVLQCLTYTPPLAGYFLHNLHKRSCTSTSFCAMCALENHVKEALASRGMVVSPSYLVKNLRCISRTFQMWRQEDAHEYMRYLIEALQRCCSVESSGTESLIESVFGGRLTSQVKCTQCSQCSNTYDPFLDLSLEIVRADSLQKAFGHFTEVEILDGENKYQCSKCKSKVRALKQFTIDKAPTILTVQFKRFSRSGKIDKKVYFDRSLDLSPYVTGGEEQNLQYSLYALLVHNGWSTHSGHYYCFVRTSRNTWHLMDDNEVTQVSEKTVFEQKAYILFYIRNTQMGNRSDLHAVNGLRTADHLTHTATRQQHQINLGVDGISLAASESCLEKVNDVKNEIFQSVSVLQSHSSKRECKNAYTHRGRTDGDVQVSHSNNTKSESEKPSSPELSLEEKNKTTPSEVIGPPKLSFLEAASEHVFRIVSMCVKFCFGPA